MVPEKLKRVEKWAIKIYIECVFERRGTKASFREEDEEHNCLGNRFKQNSRHEARCKEKGMTSSRCRSRWKHGECVEMDKEEDWLTEADYATSIVGTKLNPLGQSMFLDTCMVIK